jgi:predicted N-formylglutamate amidohydrolase
MPRARTRPLVLVTCEHGGNRIPPRYRRWFEGRERLLASHRGYDPGALPMAHSLARALGAPLIAATVSRLLIELNRSPRHRQLFSSVICRAPEAVRHELVERYYLPYRTAVTQWIERRLAQGWRVLHISSHSFTPVFHGVRRQADVGLLYDPTRALEADLCVLWRRALLERAPGWEVRRNYPYQGTSDGLTTALRRSFPPSRYAGIELELNQCFVRRRPATFAHARRMVPAALRDAVTALGGS